LVKEKPSGLPEEKMLVHAGLVERIKSGRVMTVTLRPEDLAEAVSLVEPDEIANLRFMTAPNPVLANRTPVGPHLAYFFRISRKGR
jgi:hypothetical protein